MAFHCLLSQSISWPEDFSEAMGPDTLPVLHPFVELSVPTLLELTAFSEQPHITDKETKAKRARVMQLVNGKGRVQILTI